MVQLANFDNINKKVTSEMMMDVTLNKGVVLKGYLHAKEVAERLNVSARTVIRWAKRGDLPGAIQLNPNAKTSPYMIPEEAVKNFIDQRSKGVVEVSNGDSSNN